MRNNGYWFFQIAFLVLGLIPLVFIGCLLTFFFHATYLLGYMPTYNHPDPKTLTIYEIYEPVISTTGNYWLYSIIIWVGIVVIYCIMHRKNIRWKWILLSLLANILAVLMFFSKVLEWFAD